MFFTILLKIVQIYALILFINVIVCFSGCAQNKWTTLLSKICEPAVKVGSACAVRLLKNRQVNFDYAPLAGLLLMLLFLLVINIIF